MNPMEVARKWLQWDQNLDTKREVEDLLNSENKDELKRLMCKRIEFGTAGLRARMGPGFSQLNDLVIIQTTQGLAKTLVQQHSNNPEMLQRGVVIGFDKRHNSDRFAKLTACVLLLAKIPVALFSCYVPTPYVAYSCRKYGHIAGVMITASHNPKEDNGYKLYWDNGAQIISPIDKLVQNSIEQNLEPWSGVWEYGPTLERSRQEGNLTDPLEKCSNDYLTDLLILDCSLPISSSVVLTYTAMHGVGHKYLKEAFQHAGLPNFVPVVEQCEPDPEFPTVKYPNPEEGKSALDLSIKTADENGSSVILANDPDADRLAVAEKQKSGKWKIFTGNELGTLIGWWLFDQHAQKIATGAPEVTPLSDCFMLSSTVSSRILASIAEKEGFHFEETLTGFKWMGNKSDGHLKRGKCVLFAFEEAIGYMCGSTVLDKDGISAAYVVAQMAHRLYNCNSSLTEQLDKVYAKYGIHVSHNSYYFCYDADKISQIFNRIRNFDQEAKSVIDKYPKFLNGIPLVSFRDLTAGLDSSKPDNNPDLPTSKSSEMITFHLSNGIVLTIRTSGTEPKIKFYSELFDRSKQFASCDDAAMFLKMHMKNIIAFLLEPEKNGLKPAAGLQ